MEVVALQGLAYSAFIGSRRDSPLARRLGDGRLFRGKAGEGGKSRFDNEAVYGSGILETNLHLAGWQLTSTKPGGHSR